MRLRRNSRLTHDWRIKRYTIIKNEHYKVKKKKKIKFSVRSLRHFLHFIYGMLLSNLLHIHRNSASAEMAQLNYHTRTRSELGLFSGCWLWLSFSNGSWRCGGQYLFIMNFSILKWSWSFHCCHVHWCCCCRFIHSCCCCFRFTTATQKISTCRWHCWINVGCSRSLCGATI